MTEKKNQTGKKKITIAKKTFFNFIKNTFTMKVSTKNSVSHPAQHITVHNLMLSSNKFQFAFFLYTRLSCAKWGTNPLNCYKTDDCTSVYLHYIYAWLNMHAHENM